MKKFNKSCVNAMRFIAAIILIVPFFTRQSFAQYPPLYSQEMQREATVDPLTRAFLTPQRIVWKSSDSLILKPEILLEKGTGQPFFGPQEVCRIINKGNTVSGLILDFGREIHGGIQIITSQSNRVTRRIRVRFGESVSETCSDVIGDGTTGLEGGATNHHAMRDLELTLPGYGVLEYGNTGFRFVRIDLAEPDAFVVIKQIRAIATYRDIPYLGSFKSNDERLNKIWETGAYTVHLNMQDYLYDGIKRDRMVWAGDMHPELMTINSVFGYNEVVPKSLDFLRDNTPLPKFMNGIPSYSMWWVIMQHDWFMAHGRLDYLKQQRSYLIALLDQFSRYVNDDGSEHLDSIGFRFLDWPSVNNKPAIHAGLQGLMAICFQKGAVLAATLGDAAKSSAYKQLAAKMAKYIPDASGNKEAAALLALSGIADAAAMNRQVIAVGGPKNFSSFFGYYMLEAQAKAGDYEGALNNIRKFWGGMLDLGATTFWEEFDLEEATGAAPIDDIVPAGKKDYHYSTGANCYIGLRRSLCHGWSSGPTAWLAAHVLGIQVLAPGAKQVRIVPHLGDLEWVEGTYPTPSGVIYVKHRKLANGTISSEIRLPKAIQQVK